MGIGMALNLQKHLATKGQQLHWSNRTLSKGETLTAAGAVSENDFSSLISSCDIIFTMVSFHSVAIQA